MTQRYFVNEPVQSSQVTLDGPEAHHLLHVMRARAGDEVTLFDGSGREFAACIDHTSRSTVDLSIVTEADVNRELPLAITLGVALPKGDRQKWLVEKLVEVGVAALVPLKTARGVAQPTGKAVERLRRGVIEASKQCGRNRLMTVSEPRSFADWIHQETPGTAVIAHPRGTPLASGREKATDGAVWASIGPEGGFTDDEIASAVAVGWDVVGLGERILRIETAAIATAVLLSAWTSS